MENSYFFCKFATHLKKILKKLFPQKKVVPNIWIKKES